MPLQRKLHTGKNETNVNYVLLHQVVLLKYLKEVYRRLLAILRGPLGLRGQV